MINFDKTVSKVINLLKENFDGEIYLVGGAVRDGLLNRQTNDFDFIINPMDLNALNLVAKKLNSKLVLFDKKGRTYRIAYNNYTFDFSAMCGMSIKQDLSSRDFIMNSLAVNLSAEDRGVIDFFGGVEDVKKKVIRHIKAKNFIKDPLRILRAFRFFAELNFRISNETLKLIKKYKSKLRKVAVERVVYEFLRILASNSAYETLLKCEKSGVLYEVIPKMNLMKESNKKYYFHNGGLIEHSFETLKAIENIYRNLKKYFPERYAQIQEHLNEKLSFFTTKMSLLRLIALLHDVAKPVCVKIDRDKVRFIGHEKRGAKMSEKISEKLKLSVDEKEFISRLILNHMRPFNLFNNRQITDRAKYRICRDLGDDMPSLLLLSLADCMSYSKVKIKKYRRPVKEFKKFVKDLMEFCYVKKEIESLPKIINGHVIMEKFDLKPGPLVGKLLDIAKEAQILGKIKTREEAIKLLENYVEKLKETV